MYSTTTISGFCLNGVHFLCSKKVSHRGQLQYWMNLKYSWSTARITGVWLESITDCLCCFKSWLQHDFYIQGGPKNLAPFFLYALTLPNIKRFSKLFHFQNHEKICNNTVAKDPTTPQVCRYTTLWNVSVIKATIENRTTSVTTYFKKLTTGKNVFIVSVIV